MHAAASDLAAMGATPSCALSHLTLPPRFGKQELRLLSRGQADAAALLRCPVVGGNLSRGEELSIVTTVVGSTSQPLRRDAAKAGDEIWLVGAVGLAAAGLKILQTGRAGTFRRPSATTACLSAWREPRALISKGRRLASLANAAIDLSDGLAIDAVRIAKASNRRLLLDQAALVQALPDALLQVCHQRGWDPLELALGGGEDYALLATGPARRRPSWAFPVGSVSPGSGVWLLLERGGRRRVCSGHDHFARRAGR
jgi:thiamine-monophosphate kinase